LESVGFRQAGTCNFSRLRGRLHRIFDVLNELLNFERGTLGHLLLQHPDAFDAFAVAKEKLNSSAGEQPATR
jgi:hypothetical protein